MALPQLTKPSTYTKEKAEVVNHFLGLNKGLNIGAGEFAAMHNMTNDYYPVFGNRKKRGILGSFTKPMGVVGGDKFSYVDNNKLYYNQKFVMNLAETNKERTLIIMGAYLCVFPDGIVYNTVEQTSEAIENSQTTTSAVTMQMCKLDGTNFTSSNTHIGNTAPSDTTTYPYWLDTSQEDAVVLKMWSSTYSMWTSVATTYVKISATDIGKGFKEYDSVKISGIQIKGYNDYDFNDTLIIYACADDYIIVAGLMDLYYTQNDPVTVKRELPKMDYICEFNNRLYGCRYGLNNDNEFVNEIYASKLGDPTNWFAYQGLATDSYAATCGSQGEFTGCIAYAGYVFFFKEEGFHKLYGSYPSNFQMIWRPCRGVAKGSSKSLAIVNEVLYFKARDAIVAYDGSETTISLKLDTEPYFDAIATDFKNKYYICMRDQEYKYKLYVFDSTKGTWCIEDDIRTKYMCYADNAAYIIDWDNNLYCINNEFIYTYNFPDDELLPKATIYPGRTNYAPYEDKLKWSFETGDLGYDNPYNKYVKRLNIRMQLDINAMVRIEIEYDSSGEWEYVTELFATRKKSYEVPITVTRADHIRLRLSGWGEFRLYSLTKAVENGSGEDEGE